MKRTFICGLLCLLVGFTSFGQARSTVKKCKTCGKPMKECPYGGNHSKNIQERPAKRNPPRPTVNKDGPHNSSSIGCTAAAVETFTVNGVSFQMVRVEGGSTGTYYIGETEVTQALWQAVMGNNPSYFKGSNLPVESVSWNDCKELSAN